MDASWFVEAHRALVLGELLLQVLIAAVTDASANARLAPTRIRVIQTPSIA
jgi:hypothetical protein